MIPEYLQFTGILAFGLISIIVCLIIYILVLRKKIRDINNRTKPVINENPETKPVTQNEVDLWMENDHVKSVINQLLSYDNSFVREDIISFIKNIHLFNLKKYTTDKLYDDSVMDYLFENEKEYKIYLHYTAEEEIAKEIIKTGFRFTNIFANTARELSKDITDFTFKHNQQKLFGKYIVVLCISHELYKRYLDEYRKIESPNVVFEQVLTDQPMVKDENMDMASVFPRQFVKGFVNYQTGEIVANPDFDPLYESDRFGENLKKAAENPS